MADDDNGERTLEPTQKKLDQAVERGDVAKSQELNTWFMLGAATLAFYLFAPTSARDLTLEMRGFLSNAGRLSLDGPMLTAIAWKLAFAAVSAVGLPLLMLWIAAVAGNAVQHRLVWSLDPIMPALSKISPMAGFKRLFGPAAWVNLAKGLAKIIIVGAVLIYVMLPQQKIVALSQAADVATMAVLAFDLIVKLLAATLVILAFVAGGDYLYQRRTWYERQRMSIQEMKEEFKQSEGNPEIKAKIKQMRRQKASRRMMANVPKASVVITNPTHYAVALRYEAGMGAPICVAKGLDDVAFRIRDMAAKHNIAIVENPPLARALHASVKVDAEIPGDHYKAVAEVISYVMKLKARRAWN